MLPPIVTKATISVVSLDKCWWVNANVYSTESSHYGISQFRHHIAFMEYLLKNELVSQNFHHGEWKNLNVFNVCSKFIKQLSLLLFICFVLLYCSCCFIVISTRFPPFLILGDPCCNRIDTSFRHKFQIWRAIIWTTFYKGFLHNQMKVCNW